MECSTVQLSNLSPEYHESHPTLNTIVTPDIFEAHRRVLVNAALQKQDGAVSAKTARIEPLPPLTAATPSHDFH